MLHEAALRYASFRDLESGSLLEAVAEQFGIAKRRARVRRDKWKERQDAFAKASEEEEEPLGNGIGVCRVNGCKNPPTHRPVLMLQPETGEDPISVETALLDVCEAHARNLGTEVYTDNAVIWGAIVKTWTNSGLPAPDPSALIEVQYHPIVRPPG